MFQILKYKDFMLFFVIRDSNLKMSWNNFHNIFKHFLDKNIHQENNWLINRK